MPAAIRGQPVPHNVKGGTDMRKPTDNQSQHWQHGVPWWQAPIPARLHLCRPWTRGPAADRCACGAIRPNSARRWTERNTRRNARREG